MFKGVAVYPTKNAHGFVVLCFVVTQPFIMNSHEVFIHIHQGCFAGTGAIVRLPQCQWSKPDGYGKIGQCITTTKHSKAKTVCIFLGIYCICLKGVTGHESKCLPESYMQINYFYLYLYAEQLFGPHVAHECWWEFFFQYQSVVLPRYHQGNTRNRVSSHHESTFDLYRWMIKPAFIQYVVHTVQRM